MSTFTTNTLYYRNTASLRKRAIYANTFFGLINHRGIVTRTMIAVIAVAVATYLIAAYSLFGLAVTLQKKTATLKELNESNTIAELNLQQKQTEFARSNNDILQSMEKISEMRYIVPTDTAVSRAGTNDHANQ